VADRGTPHELAEFTQLSSRIADRKATDAERARWRELRLKLTTASPTAAEATNPGVVLKGQPRKEVRVSKKLRFAYTAEKAMPIGFSDEVSAGGLRLTLHHHVDVGAMFLLRLQLAGPNDPDPLTAAAKVAWVKREGNHFQVGLEFVGLKPDESERIAAWMHANRDG
jgi:hypothetical protein